MGCSDWSTTKKYFIYYNCNTLRNPNAIWAWISQDLDYALAVIKTIL